jgi:Spy/CpxP family protein refolding chaperone
MKYTFNPIAPMLLALAMLVPCLVHAQARSGGLGNLSPKRIDRMAEKLELSADTTERIKNLVYENQKRQIEIKASAQAAQLELRRHLDQDSPDRNQVMSQIESLGGQQVKMRKLKVGLLLDIRGLLTADQRQGLKKLLRRGRKGKKAHRKGKRGQRGEKGKRRHRRGDE